ncbi:ribonuclease H-like domain-containing protein, partial [Tanacetum coccineum]
EFSMKDLGSLNYFLGISVTRDSTWLFVCQHKYAIEILEWAGMVNCYPSQTPIDNKSKLGDIGDIISDLTLYRSLACSLQYLTFTRPDISYVVQQVCLYMHDPWEPYFSALKRILRYVRGTLDYVIMEYLVNISKRHAVWSLNEDISKINDSDNQYVVSIKEDMAYPCLHSPKTTKE